MILLIDNYDSFVFNLAQALGTLGVAVRVARNDALTLDDVRALEPRAIVLSPGPGRPEEAGICIDLIREHELRAPILGVCLGHQAIAVAFGGSVVRAPVACHGKASPVEHTATGIFQGLPPTIDAGRYHSLVAEREHLPDSLGVTAWTRSPDHGEIVMGLAHKDRPIFGVQFHPESVLTPHGHKLLRNFVDVAYSP